MDTQLSFADCWNISANALHSDSYIASYIGLLQKAIPNKEATLFDTACGTGFPSLYLHRLGYHHITANDGDEGNLEIIKTRFATEDIHIPLKHIKWQDITEKTLGQFGGVINIDNSLVYCDSWNLTKPLSRGYDDVKKSIKDVLKNFYSVTRVGGVCVVALAKNNVLGGQDKDIDIGALHYDDKELFVTWHLKYHWELRQKEWISRIAFDTGDVQEISAKSYLITRDELEEMMFEVGFKNITTLSSEILYDNLLVGKRL